MTANIDSDMSTDIDMMAVELVALDGHQMALKKEERIEAINLMIKHGVPKPIMAWRLCLSTSALERFARTKNIKIPSSIVPAHWTLDYIDKRTPEYRKQAAIERAKKKRERERQARVNGAAS